MIHVCNVICYINAYWYDYSKVSLCEDSDGSIHLKNLSLHVAANEEEGLIVYIRLYMCKVTVVYITALNWLFIGDTNRIIAEVKRP